MKSSAMRDLMAVTARPEVISLAGGLPDTSTFPPETFAAVAAADRRRVVREGAAVRARPRASTRPRTCIAEVMAAEGMRVDRDDMIVTTGGQQVIDLVTKTLIDPGDVVIAEAPDLSGRGARRSPSYEADVVQIEMDADGMRIDLLEETLDRLEREGRRPKFIYTVPTFQNPAGVTMSLRAAPAAGGDRARARAARAGGQPVRPAALRGRRRCRRCYSLDGGVYVMYLGTFSKILSPGIRLGWVVAPPPVLEKINLGKQARRPVHLDALAADGAGLLRARRAGATTWTRSRDLYRERRDTMLDALAELFPPQAEWTRPRGGLFIWATLPDFIDTTDLLARALRDNVAFVPGEAAYLDGRGRSSMRLNFSGSRRGRRSARASAASARWSTSRSSCTGRSPAERGAAQPPAAPAPRRPRTSPTSALPPTRRRARAS